MRSNFVLGEYEFISSVMTFILRNCFSSIFLSINDFCVFEFERQITLLEGYFSAIYSPRLPQPHPKSNIVWLDFIFDKSQYIANVLFSATSILFDSQLQTHALYFNLGPKITSKNSVGTS